MLPAHGRRDFFHLQCQAKNDPQRVVFCLVPLTGVEPVRYFYRGILSPLRLPIPPQWRIFIFKQTLRSKKIAAGFLAPQQLIWRRHPDLNRGVRVLQTLALPLGYGAIKKQCGSLIGAGDEIRTRDIHLGKVTLYH